MKINDRIFWIAIVVILVINKAIEMLNGFDMVINPIETSEKIIIMVGLTYEFIKVTLLPKAKKAC